MFVTVLRGAWRVMRVSVLELSWALHLLLQGGDRLEYEFEEDEEAPSRIVSLVAHVLPTAS
jgi:hypothetical protein